MRSTKRSTRGFRTTRCMQSTACPSPQVIGSTQGVHGGQRKGSTRGHASLEACGQRGGRRPGAVTILRRSREITCRDARTFTAARARGQPSEVADDPLFGLR
jgi:hypothetical protein